jgi:hypothetical protein
MADTPWTDETERRALQRLTLALVESCVRNSVLEDWHAGREVISPAGDFSDVKIVSPAGEIPYLEASRISAARWDKPKLNTKMVKGILRQMAIRDGADPAALYAQDLPEAFAKPED